MTRSVQDAHATGFADRMREATKVVHREAERSGFIADLIRGRADVRGYAVFLRNLAPAYQALETALDSHLDTPVIQAFADPRLRRLPSLISDLVAIAGPDWTSACAPTREALAYARAVEDLSGGQILKPLLARTLGLGRPALAFYHFPAFADLGTPKAAMRGALDEVPVDGAAAERIIAEAIAAFRHNIAVSEAVQAALAEA